MLGSLSSPRASWARSSALKGATTSRSAFPQYSTTPVLRNSTRNGTNQSNTCEVPLWSFQQLESQGLLARGPGAISLDSFIRRRLPGNGSSAETECRPPSLL